MTRPLGLMPWLLGQRNNDGHVASEKSRELSMETGVIGANSQLPDAEKHLIPSKRLITPMMEQYIEIKAANPDCLLFYRMGDFYELFFDDAETASRALGIMLTKRGKHLGRDIPMCGVPIERADEY